MNERRRIIEGAGSVVYPVKGDIIRMDLGNSTPYIGVRDLYRVLNTEGSIAEVCLIGGYYTYFVMGASSI